MKKIVLMMTALLVVGLAFAQTPQEKGLKGLLKSQQAITKSSILTKAAKFKSAKKATLSPQKADGDYTPVTPPSDLKTTEMPLEGLDLIYEETLDLTVNVGTSGSDVYVQGLVPVIPDAWVKGTMEDGIVTFEPQFVGYLDDIEPCFLMSCDDEDNLLPFVMFYDAEINAYDAEGLMLLYPNTEELDYEFVQGLYLGIHIGDRPDVVTPPDEMETTKMRFSGLNYDDEKVSGKVYVGFDGKDVYIQNLVSQVPDAWIKGTMNDDFTQVTFPCGQYVGVCEAEATPVYILGLAEDEDADLGDIIFNYDKTNNTFESQTYLIINARKDEVYFYDYFQPGLVIEEPTGYSATLVEVPEDLKTEVYLFVGTDIYEEEEVIKEVNVGFYGENEVYIQGLSDYVEDAWVKGELNDGTLSIPGWLLGEYDSMYGFLDIVLIPATFKYDKDSDTFTTDAFASFSEEMDSNMDEYENVVITKVVDKPAMPKQPEITEFIEADYGNSIKMEISAKDTDEKPLIPSKLSYQLFIDIEKEVSELTFTPDYYEFLDEEMTVVPYDFTDYYDFAKHGKQVYLNQPEQENWNKIGVKCIYMGGGETNSTEISWYVLKEYDPNGISNITSDATEQPIYNLQGMRVSKMQKNGLYIQGGKKFIK